jgi:hypothetical protein
MEMMSDDNPMKGLVNDSHGVDICIPSLSKFFYHLNLNDGFEEWGIAYVDKGDLEREVCFSVKDIDGNIYPSRTNIPSEIKDGYGVVRSYVPTDFRSILAIDDAVPCSIEPGVLSPVQLQEKTLLGKLDGHIQSVDAVELRLILGDQIAIAVQNHEGPFVLKSKTVDLSSPNSKVAAHAAYLRPSTPQPKMQPGTIIYNSSSNRFEGLTKRGWVVLGEYQSE